LTDLITGFQNTAFFIIREATEMSSILATWTGKKVSSSAGYGSLSFKYWRNERRFQL